MPQVFQVSEIARPAYYDRQALPVIGSYTGALGNHAAVVRWSYTPVGGGAAFIEAIQVTHIIQTVAGVYAGSGVVVDFLPFNGGTVTIAGVNQFGNVQYTLDRIVQTSFGYMAYGDVLKATTFNSNTGGTNIYTALFKGTEFIY